MSSILYLNKPISTDFSHRADSQFALDVVTKAKKLLIESGLLLKDFSSAEDLLERRKNLLKYTTGSSRLDSFLGGE